MKRLTYTLLLITIIGSKSILAQELDFEYKYNAEKQEHSVVNIPKDSSYLQWGIWLNTSDPDFTFHTMKLFLKKDQALYLDHFQGIAEIILDGDIRMPISVFWDDVSLSEYGQFEKILAFQFNEEESNTLLTHNIKKILFYTSYGKFHVKFANKDLVAKGLYTLKYNIDIFNRTRDKTMYSKVEAKSPFK